MLLSVCGIKAQKTQMSVDVKQPGTLAECIGKSNMFSVKDLTIKGQLNTDDVIFLREMAGRDTLCQEVKDGQLESLNLREVTFVADNRSFVRHEKTLEQIVTTGSDLPNRLFCGCHLKNITFPVGTRKIGEAAFYGNRLTSVVLPEYAELGSMAFAKNSELQEIIFPQTITSWMQHVFSGCDQIKVLKPNNVVYFAAILSPLWHHLSRSFSMDRYCMLMAISLINVQS